MSITSGFDVDGAVSRSILVGTYVCTADDDVVVAWSLGGGVSVGNTDGDIDGSLADVNGSLADQDVSEVGATVGSMERYE